MILGALVARGRPKINFNQFQDQFTKLCWLNSGAIMEGGKIISNHTYLIWRYTLSKNQRLSIREKLQKYLKFDSGCTVWQSTPQSMLNINLSNFVG